MIFPAISIDGPLSTTSFPWSFLGLLWPTFGWRLASLSISFLNRASTFSVPLPWCVTFVKKYCCACSLLNRRTGSILRWSGFICHSLAFNLSWHWAIDPKEKGFHIQLRYGMPPISLQICQISNSFWRVYAVLAVYLLVCSFWLTVKAFAVCVISLPTHAYLLLCEVYSESAKRQNVKRSRCVILPASNWRSYCCHDFDLRYVLIMATALLY